MRFALRWSWWIAVALVPASALLLVGGFSLGAVYSRAQESLAVRNGLLDALLLLLGLWVLALVVWMLLAGVLGIVAFIQPSTRVAPARTIAGSGAVLLGCAIGIVFSPRCVRALAYSDEQAVESLISEFDPVVGAVRRYQADHGHAPQSLSELVPTYITRIPRPDVIDTPIDVRFDRLDQDWRLQADAYLQHGFAPSMPLADMVYLGSQDYQHGRDMAGTSLAEFERSFRGWRWRIR